MCLFVIIGGYLEYIKVEEEFTVARLFVSKMKSEAKNLVTRATNLEQQQTEANRKCEEMEKGLSECRLTIVQVIIILVFRHIGQTT